MANARRKGTTQGKGEPAATGTLIPVERIERTILLIRGEKVILDTDLAALYGVTTKRLNEQVRRNQARFPPDFMFQLTPEEKAEVVANCDHLAQLKYSSSAPFAFTEHGALMAANVLSSPRAVAASVAVVRAFIRLRQMLSSHEGLRRKLEELEQRVEAQFKQVFSTLYALMEPPEIGDRERIGF